MTNANHNKLARKTCSKSKMLGEFNTDKTFVQHVTNTFCINGHFIQGTRVSPDVLYPVSTALKKPDEHQDLPCFCSLVTDSFGKDSESSPHEQTYVFLHETLSVP